MIIYFIKPVDFDGPIKIGRSKSPDGRRSTLETWSPFALELLAQVEGPASLEGRFHAAFKKYHQRREWFDPAPALVAAIEAIKEGTFDFSALPSPINFKGIARQKWDAPEAGRYRQSVMGRLRGAGFHFHEARAVLLRVTGGSSNLLDHRDEIEAELRALGCRRSPVSWGAAA